MSSAARDNPLLHGKQQERNPKNRAAEVRGENETAHDREDRQRHINDDDDTG